MDRETALQVLREASEDERFAAVLCRVSQYAVGKSPIRTYWSVRINPLRDNSSRWHYCDTPGDWHRLQNETPK
jgi:hypothetical protein